MVTDTHTHTETHMDAGASGYAIPIGFKEDQKRFSAVIATNRSQ
jgi:hypothetical protein